LLSRVRALDRLGVGHQPPHDHLAVAHVVFLDLRALAASAAAAPGVAGVASYSVRAIAS
jgi:hypothetical protein